MLTRLTIRLFEMTQVSGLYFSTISIVIDRWVGMAKEIHSGNYEGYVRHTMYLEEALKLVICLLLCADYTKDLLSMYTTTLESLNGTYIHHC
jgi:hypothetical protein